MMYLLKPLFVLQWGRFDKKVGDILSMARKLPELVHTRKCNYYLHKSWVSTDTKVELLPAQKLKLCVHTQKYSYYQHKSAITTYTKVELLPTQKLVELVHAQKLGYYLHKS